MRTQLRSLLQITTAALGLAFAACATPDGSAMQDLTNMGCTVSTHGNVCDPADTKKTTVCHIPPGNPANAHSICVGNAAVPAHLAHGDFVGTCSCPGGGDVDAGTGGGGGGDIDASLPPPPPPGDIDAGIVISPP